MNLREKLKNTDVLILCGGKGTRLRSIVRNRPKAMVEFGRRPFLSILIEYLASFGFRRFILCTGYKAKFIEEYYNARPPHCEISYSNEKKPLGTAGAIKNAIPLIRSNPFLAINGDSFCRLNFLKFLDFHLKKKAMLSIALVASSKDKNCGKVALDSKKRIISFAEKKASSVKSLDSAGIYLIDKELFSFMNSKKAWSLEYDLFPSLKKKNCFGFKQNLDLIDFGTPSGYIRARKLFSKH